MAHRDCRRSWGMVQPGGGLEAFLFCPTYFFATPSTPTVKRALGRRQAVSLLFSACHPLILAKVGGLKRLHFCVRANKDDPFAGNVY